MKEYSELKMLAEKATPGPWHIDSHSMTMTSMESFKTVFNHPTDRPSVRHEETGNLSNWRNDWDASYIATANPKVILEILENLESLKKDAARYRWLRQYDFDIGSYHPEGDFSHESWFERFDDQSIDRMIAEEIAFEEEAIIEANNK